MYALGHTSLQPWTLEPSQLVTGMLDMLLSLFVGRDALLIHAVFSSEVQFGQRLALRGMRRGELLGLRWCDIDLGRASISVVQTLYRLSGGEFVNKRA